jgi:hypothetical protein
MGAISQTRSLDRCGQDDNASSDAAVPISTLQKMRSILSEREFVLAKEL